MWRAVGHRKNIRLVVALICWMKKGGGGGRGGGEREGAMVCRREEGGGTDDEAELGVINKDPNLQTNRYKPSKIQLNVFSINIQIINNLGKKKTNFCKKKVKTAKNLSCCVIYCRDSYALFTDFYQ